MARVNPQLHSRLQATLNLGPRQVDRRISAVAIQLLLPRHLAAICLAADSGITVTRFANPQELELVRHARLGGARAATAVTPTSTPPARKSHGKRTSAHRRARKPGSSVFVVHGRNESLRKSIFQFLRALGLTPIEWRKAIELTGKPSPYVGEILDAAFTNAVAVLVLLSPDDEAKLKDQFIQQSDDPLEKTLTPQPRANVLFEAGMAFGRNPNATVLVQVGTIRQFSDIAGRHVVRLTNTVQSRMELVTKLKSAGCSVDDSGTDWHTEGDFAD